jgi:hypothetical protein
MANPAINRRATIVLSLWDENHSPIEAPGNYLSAHGVSTRFQILAETPKNLISTIIGSQIPEIRRLGFGHWWPGGVFVLGEARHGKAECQPYEDKQ